MTLHRLSESSKLWPFSSDLGEMDAFFEFSGKFCIKNDFSPRPGDVSTSSKRRSKIGIFDFFLKISDIFHKIVWSLRVKEESESNFFSSKLLRICELFYSNVENVIRMKKMFFTTSPLSLRTRKTPLGVIFREKGAFSKWRILRHFSYR